MHITAYHCRPQTRAGFAGYLRTPTQYNFPVHPCTLGLFYRALSQKSPTKEPYRVWPRLPTPLPNKVIL